MKLFVNSQTFMPRTWSKAIGQHHVHNSAHLVVIAARKSDGGAMFVERGQYAHLMAETKLVSRNRPFSTDLKLLTEAGVIDLETPSVFIYNRGVKDDPVFRVEPDGKLVLVAHFRYEGKVDGRGMWIELVEKEDQ
ncbi:hypothetical protein ACIBCT_35760 [Streptosporangium sp. NPDC050855]|uniref:hypothetical protein n=1 Tax=Streptosporangium sp. NPDC050855 TaxID=3366194 RepID=UPI0037B622DD